ncbi:MAG: SMC-Scp complex subunit ScpB [Bdellovibrionales bacterium]|nr:SMC-Scp complex subunit ScpB [Bdellovibrionales bacterium]
MIMNKDAEKDENKETVHSEIDSWVEFERDPSLILATPLLDEEAVTLGDSEEQDDPELSAEEEASQFSAEGTELEGFESAAVEDAEFIEDDRVISIVESLLFSTEKPISMAQMRQVFKGTTATSKQIRWAIDQLAVEFAGMRRGITIEEINSGFQVRTKIDNLPYLRRLVKTRPFKLSGPALEVMAIVAYKQPVTKGGIDEIRGVESGHLLRGLMEKSLVNFAGKSELPGKPMLYATTRKFLETFGLRNIRELPSLSEIDELIPEGIGEISEFDKKNERLEDITGDLSREAGFTYSEGEEELLKISSELEVITTSSNFFEEEKLRAKEKRDKERAQDVRDAITLGDTVEAKDRKWLERYEKSLEEAKAASEVLSPTEEASSAKSPEEDPSSIELEIETAFNTFFDTGKQPDEKESWESLPVKAVDKKPSSKIGNVSFDNFEKDLEVFKDSQ